MSQKEAAAAAMTSVAAPAIALRTSSRTRDDDTVRFTRASVRRRFSSVPAVPALTLQQCPGGVSLVQHLRAGEPGRPADGSGGEASASFASGKRRGRLRSRLPHAGDQQCDAHGRHGSRQREDRGKAPEVGHEAGHERPHEARRCQGRVAEPDVGRPLGDAVRELQQYRRCRDGDGRMWPRAHCEHRSQRLRGRGAERGDRAGCLRCEPHHEHEPVPRSVSEPAEHEVADHLPAEVQRGERAHVPLARVQGANRVHGEEAVGHRAEDAEGPGDEEPAEVGVPTEQRRRLEQIRRQRHGLRGGHARRLTRARQRDVGDREEYERGEEAEAVAPRRRDRGQEPRNEPAPEHPAGRGHDVGGPEEPPAKRGRDRAADDVQPCGHQHAAGARHRQDQREEHAERQARRRIGEEERDARQPQHRHALPHRIAQHERQLSLEPFRVVGGDQRRQEPPERQHRGDGADEHVRGAEVNGERRKHRGRRRERHADQKQRVVEAEGEDVVADGCPGHHARVRWATSLSFPSVAFPKEEPLSRTPVSLALVMWIILVAAAPGAAAPAGDAYIEGYAAAVLAERFGRTPGTLSVKAGGVTLAAPDIAGLDRDAVVAALQRIPGIVRVDITDAAAVPSTAPPVTNVTPPAQPTGAPPEEPDKFELVSSSAFQAGFLPGGLLFPPLIADPRWPHFSAAYQYYINDRDFSSVAAVSFGETFTLYRWDLAPHWLEIGIQAGVFSIFDMNSSSFDLINADYLAAFVLGYRQDKLAALARIFHQSSHLGDEFLLSRSNVDRINLSYEGIDLRVSYEFLGDVLRPYAGAGYLFHRDPSDLQPWWVEYGLEFRWPGSFGHVRPIAAVDIQQREQNGWSADISVRAGVQFSQALQARTIQLLLEYFNGRSPNGQFFEQKIDYMGVGLHFHF